LQERGAAFFFVSFDMWVGCETACCDRIKEFKPLCSTVGNFFLDRARGLGIAWVVCWLSAGLLIALFCILSATFVKLVFGSGFFRFLEREVDCDFLAVFLLILLF
jgi:hypothetical protein